MKLNFLFGTLKKYLRIALIFLLIFQLNQQSSLALSMRDSKEGNIFEELRLNVPYKYKEVWLKAEKEVWEPWLSNQDGFLGRQIFYNDEKEEALLLVNWENRKLWKKISIEEVKKIQNNFEENVKDKLDISYNPFEFVYEGELFKQQ
tara:strand:- start:1552 stop:1992 length:441 start_codon:yes stop_codon:yes gene_type:complete